MTVRRRSEFLPTRLAIVGISTCSKPEARAEIVSESAAPRSSGVMRPMSWKISGIRILDFLHLVSGKNPDS
jgi:hypothetical protein